MTFQPCVAQVWHKKVNRHTGGLEKSNGLYAPNQAVNRHTGGLENKENEANGKFAVNRHTGGLEIAPSY